MKLLNTFIAGLLLTSALVPVPASAQSPVSVIGPIIVGDCAQFSSVTIIKDAGVTCNGGGGGGGPGGSNGQFQYNNAGSFGGITLFITPQQFGAVGDGVHNDTSNINSAIAAVPSSGLLFIPCGTYLLSGSGTEIFLLTKPIRIIGGGACTSFTGTIGNSTILFHMKPAASTALVGSQFSQFAINVTGGQNLFSFDTTNAGSEIFQLDVSYIIANTATTSDTIILNGLSGNGGHTTFQTYIHDNIINSVLGSSAIACTFCGDTITISRNALIGAGFDIAAFQVAGAGQLIIDSNNLTANNGIDILEAISLQITNNEIELNGPLVSGAAINLNGATGTGISNALVSNNGITVNGGVTGFFETIFANVVTNLIVDGNRFSSSVNGTAIDIGASATNAIIGCQNNFTGFTTNLANSGTGTQPCIPLPFTPTLIGGSVAGSATYTFNVGSYSIVGGNVTARFSIDVASWSTASGSVILNLAGLPASSATSNDNSGCSIFDYNIVSPVANTFGMTGIIAPGNSEVQLAVNGNGASTNFLVSNAGVGFTVEGVCLYHM